MVIVLIRPLCLPRGQEGTHIPAACLSIPTSRKPDTTNANIRDRHTTALSLPEFATFRPRTKRCCALKGAAPKGAASLIFL